MHEEDTGPVDDQLPLEGVGERLRRSRTDQGLSLEEVASTTKIAQRHLHMMEEGDFDGLPARTYAFGFTRTYASVLGLDGQALANQLREELGNNAAERPRYTPGFEPGDPGKVPPRGVIWASVAAALILAVGAYAFYASSFAPGADPASLIAARDTDQSAEPFGAGTAGDEPRDLAPTLVAAASSPNEVTFTALEEGIWVSFYEAGGKRLEQKLMAEGEQFTVPSDADDPRIWTGRPDAFAITVGGKPVPKLADDEVVIRDVEITAEALRSRDQTSGPASSSANLSGNNGLAS